MNIDEGKAKSPTSIEHVYKVPQHGWTAHMNRHKISLEISLVIHAANTVAFMIMIIVITTIVCNRHVCNCRV
jgi:hypothetical protein